MWISRPIALIALAVSCTRAPDADRASPGQIADTSRSLLASDSTAGLVAPVDCRYNASEYTESQLAQAPFVRDRQLAARLVSRLDSLGRAFATDTVFVASGQSSYAMAGQPADSTLLAAFMPLFSTDWMEAPLFVIGSLPLGPAWRGYLLRSPGMYDASRIELWPYNQETGLFGTPHCVADSWGDEGASWYTVSWLIDRDHDGVRDLIQLNNRSVVDIETDSLLFDSTVTMAWRGVESPFRFIGPRPDSATGATLARHYLPRE